MLINLSNHPSMNWSESQLSAAKQYGEIIDMPFPVIDPSADEEAIYLLANEYADRILGMRVDDDVTVHVMGEMIFTYKIVSTLKASGIECVASTTLRKVKDTADGKKISEFEFVRFRRY
jgi:hypothetical protein